MPQDLNQWLSLVQLRQQTITWAIVDSNIKRHQGGRLNIKMSSYQYRDIHVKDKTVSRPSYL